MRVIVDGTRLDIQFRYEAHKKNRPVTWCEIYGSDEQYGRTLLGVGLAMCHRKDQFTKEMGRTIAFQRAVDQGRTAETLSRIMRKALYMAFIANVDGWPTYYFTSYGGYLRTPDGNIINAQDVQ